MKYHYDILRLTSENNRIGIEEEYTTGQILGEYLMNHPRVEKKQVFLWLREITDQLPMGEEFKDGEIELSPFRVILTEDKHVVFSNPNSKINQKHFQRLPISTQENPLSAYGKLIQFIIYHSNIIPKLKKREKKKIDRLVCECCRVKQEPHKPRLVTFFFWIAIFSLSMLAIVVPDDLFVVNLNRKREIRVENSEAAVVEEAFSCMRDICENDRLSETEKGELLKTILNKNPELLSKKRFASMKEYYKFRIEGGKIWFN